MSKILSDRKYLECHLWFAPDPVNPEQGEVGITDNLQARLGDLVAVELPRAGTVLGPDDTLAVLEGLLDASELNAFTQMTVLETNPRLEVSPDLVNRDCYAKGYLAKVRLDGLARFLEAPDYAQYTSDGVVGEGA